MAERLFLLDAMNLIFRSYYALSGRGFTTPSGEPTSATYGVAVTLVKILREEKPDYLAVLMDAAGPTFRHEKFEGYKASRPPMPDDLAVQLPRVREVMAAMDLAVLECPGYEADDCIGTLTARARKAGTEVVIWSGDKDLLQLVGNGVTAVVPGRGVEETRTLDAAGVKEKLGIPPEQVVDYLSLIGDSIDDIPGVPGVGPVTAAQLLAKFGSVDALYARLDEVERASLREKLRAHEPAVRRNRELVTVHPEVPLDAPLDALRVHPLSRAKVMPVFQAIASRRLVDLANQLIAATGGGGTPRGSEAVRAVGPERAAGRERASGTPSGAAPPSLFDRAAGSGAAEGERVETSGAPTPSLGPARSMPGEAILASATPPSAVAFLRAARAGGGIAVIADAHRSLTGRVEAASLAMAMPSGLAIAVPWHAVLEGGDLHEDLRAAFRHPALAKWTPDLKTLHRVLSDVEIPLAGPLLDTDVARRMCEGTGSDEEGDLLDAFEGDALPTARARDATQASLDLETAPSTSPVAVAAEEEATALLERARGIARDIPELMRRVEAAGLGELYREVEVPLAAVLADMETHGIAVDLEELRRLSRDLAERVRGLEAEIYGMAGGPFNVNSTRQLKEVLFGRLGLSPGRRTRTGFSTDAEVLKKLAADHPLPGLILEHRHLSKLRSTYAEALASLVDPATHRLHTTYNALGAATGRISSRDPNLQNIPIRTEAGKAFRRAFIPGEPGWHLVSADYSQIELRILAHVTGEEGLIEAFHTGMDFHVATSAQLLGIAPEAVTRDIRDKAKAVNYGILYGMGARSLAQNLRITEKEARDFIGSYFARYTRVERFIRETIERARATGYVSTIYGRRRILPELQSSRGDVRSMGERAAVNAVIQGSAADIMKKALVAIHRMLADTGSPARLLLTVHDEIVLEAPADADLDALIARVVEGMCRAASLRVPLEVSAGHGVNWLEAHG